MRIALIFNTTRPDTTGGYLARACRALGLSCDQWRLQDAERIPEDYDLYLRIDHGDDYFVRLPDRLRPSVFYAIDTHLPHIWRKIRRVAGRFDAVFCAHRDAADRLPGAEWLPVACDPSIHAPMFARGRSLGIVPSERCESRDDWELHGSRGDVGASAWDVAFVGTDGGVPRKFYLQALRERYPASFIGTAEHTRLAAIYGRSRVGFNYSIADDVNMRTFEVLAAGALLVTNALRHDDLAALGLEDRRDLVLYRSPGELMGTIDHYLAHPEERRAIAEAGCALVRARHTYTHRMRQLLASVHERLGVGAPQLETKESFACASS